MDKHGFDRTFQRLKLLKEIGFTFSTICDIGASSGTWSRECLKIFPCSQYFCVEPLDEHQFELQIFEKEYPNVKYWQGCFGEKKKEGILNVDGCGSSILRGHWNNDYGTPKEVEIDTLDNFVSRGICTAPDLIKLDVQGYELKVLSGAVNTLKLTQAIITEISFFHFQAGMPVFHEIVAQLNEYGFVVSDILSLNPRPLDNMAGQADLLFIKGNHSLLADNKWDKNSIY